MCVLVTRSATKGNLQILQEAGKVCISSVIFHPKYKQCHNPLIDHFILSHSTAGTVIPGLLAPLEWHPATPKRAVVQFLMFLLSLCNCLSLDTAKSLQ